MPDEEEHIRARLGKLGLGTQRENEIIRELGDHVEDHAAELAASGVPSKGAVQRALDCVPDWTALRNQILSAETGEGTMNYRTRVLWLPAFVALILSSGLLAVLQFVGLVPRFYWLNRQMSGYPFFTFYIAWLGCLPIVGAIAALWSQRAGGGSIQRLAAAMAPSLGMLGFLLIGPLLSMLIFLYDSFIFPGHRHVIRFSAHLFITAHLTLLVSWVVAPAVGLLVGALPFLRKPQPQA